jgi:hypothetical protein
MATLAEMLRQGADRLINLPSEAQRFITNPQAFTQLLTGKNSLPRETGFAAGATGLPAQEMSVLDPNQAAYMQGYSQGEPIGYAGMAAPFAAPAAVATAKALAPKAGMMAENYMVRQGMIQPLTAYHGTPHTIQGQFDINKVGTGEGAQAYGHGIYFAENPLVAKEYQTALSNPEVVLKSGERISKPALGTGEDVAKAWLEEQFLQGSKNPFDDALAKITKLRNSANNPAQFDDAVKVLNNWKSQGATVDLGGNLYKVDIPDADIPNMLDWDKPLSQQPANVQNWLKDPYNFYREKLTAKDIGGNEPTGSLIYNRLQELMSEGKKSDVFANQANLGALNASRELADYGITGVRYLDEGSRGVGKGTSNFVVFEPSQVKILEQNNKPVSRKELIQEQINKIE